LNSRGAQKGRKEGEEEEDEEDESVDFRVAKGGLHSSTFIL
jgi:hypothetical protein